MRKQNFGVYLLCGGEELDLRIKEEYGCLQGGYSEWGRVDSSTLMTGTKVGVSNGHPRLSVTQPKRVLCHQEVSTPSPLLFTSHNRPCRYHHYLPLDGSIPHTGVRASPGPQHPLWGCGLPFPHSPHHTRTTLRLSLQLPGKCPPSLAAVLPSVDDLCLSFKPHLP